MAASAHGRGAPTPDNPREPRRRDAARTRQLLLDAARRRFIADGYSATTVREIAEDAGVNVALISRYFESKEGLFQSCLAAACDELRHTVGTVSPDQLPHSISSQITGHSADGAPNQLLLLLLRSSGDERAEQIRLEVLRTFTERLASHAGWRPDHPDSDQLLLRAQLVLAASIGIVLLRASPRPEPLASATTQDLSGPLHDLVNALLPRAGTDTPAPPKNS